MSDDKFLMLHLENLMQYRNQSFKCYSTGLLPPYKYSITSTMSFWSFWEVTPLCSFHLIRSKLRHPRQQPLPSPLHTSFPIQSGELFTNMSRLNVTNPAKLKKLVKIFLWMPQILVPAAMKLAEYSNKEITDVSFRCSFQRTLPGGSLKGLRAHIAGDVPTLLSCPQK